MLPAWLSRGSWGVLQGAGRSLSLSPRARSPVSLERGTVMGVGIKLELEPSEESVAATRRWSRAGGLEEFLAGAGRRPRPSLSPSPIAAASCGGWGLLPTHWGLFPPAPGSPRPRTGAAACLRLAGSCRRGHSSGGGGKGVPEQTPEAAGAKGGLNSEWNVRPSNLYENPWTIPNLLSMTRIALAPVLGYLIIEEDFNVALGVFALAGLTDLLDGFIARNWANQKSALGSALDPLADKILISVLYISLTYANLIPVSLTYMIISRDIVLIAAVFYVRYRTLPSPRTLARYFNPCYATARLKPTFISKVNTAVQLILVAASLAAPVFNYTESIYLQTLWCLTAFTTTASAYSYYHYGRKTVQVIKGK
ncbi:cardiolipin synthase (CMP-forming) [Gracilinanus agilis]|uniref:cardiolipin synthase (CMP-forming) n=1 Tax=Gracilinanus agilis TaxID=191870 RepID=UPI001CFDB4D1|nr:cardiolipin synthase (CMP-forming) [Gracilinanus agilis]